MSKQFQFVGGLQYVAVFAIRNEITCLESVVRLISSDRDHLYAIYAIAVSIAHWFGWVIELLNSSPSEITWCTSIVAYVKGNCGELLSGVHPGQQVRVYAQYALVCGRCLTGTTQAYARVCSILSSFVRNEDLGVRCWVATVPTPTCTRFLAVCVSCCMV